MARIAILILAVMFLSLPVQAQETPLHTIAVAGEVELRLPPDYATIELGVISQGVSVSDALADNSAKMTRVIAAVKALGVRDADIQTSQFEIQLRYAANSTPGNYQDQNFRTITGYYVVNQVTAKVRDLKNVAKVIDDGAKAGANQTSNVTFNVNSIADHFDDARRQAVENARHKAEVLAAASHVQLGATLSITDNQADRSYSARPNAIEQVVVSASRIATPIEPGQVSVSATVTVVYAIQ